MEKKILKWGLFKVVNNRVFVKTIENFKKRKFRALYER